MRWHKAHEQYLANRKPVAAVDVVWSQRNTDFYGRDNAAELVDTPVRGFVYEAAGRVEPHHLERGATAVRAAAERWRIPAEVVAEDPSDWRAWTHAMVDAAERLVRRPVG